MLFVNNNFTTLKQANIQHLVTNKFITPFFSFSTTFNFIAKCHFINIEQLVKQVDPLSCSLFILCMDPLIRKVNRDNEIEGLNIGINGE